MPQPEYSTDYQDREELPNSPRVNISAEGVIRVTRLYSVKSSELKTEQNRFGAGKTSGFGFDATYGSSNVLFTSSTASDNGSGAGVLTVNFEGGLMDFVERKDAFTVSENIDQTATITRSYVGPPSKLASFFNTNQIGTSDWSVTRSVTAAETGYRFMFLKDRRIRESSNGLAEATFIFDGTIGSPDPGASFGEQVTTSYIRESIQFSPWASGLGRQPVITAEYYSETASVSYVSRTRPNSPSRRGALSSSGSNTYLFNIQPASFSPSCPHSLTKKKITTNFSTTNIPGSDLYRVLETHQWKITDGETTFG